MINPPKFGGRIWNVKKEEQVIGDTELDPDKLHEEIEYLENEHSKLSREVVRLRRERNAANERAEKLRRDLDAMNGCWSDEIARADRLAEALRGVSEADTFTGAKLIARASLSTTSPEPEREDG